METKSNQVLVGGTVIALLIVLLFAIMWLARVGGGDKREYDIFFKQAVDGLAVGSGVVFSGVPAGEVKSIDLMPESPEFKRVRVAVKAEVPVLQGTTATIQGVGFTGVSQVQLDGAVKGAPPISQPGPFGVPVIPTKPGTLAGLLNSAPELLNKLSTLTTRLGMLLDDRNQNSIHHILENIDKVSSDLAASSPQMKQTLANAQVAIKQAGDAAQQISKLASTTNQLLDEQGRPVMTNLNETIKSAKQAADNLNQMITDAKPGVETLSKQTAPQIDQLVRDLSDMAEALTQTANRLNSGGGGVLGRKLPDYKPAH
jgi:phospholipid/cholesterol/gamma-HCH transport system substrate-binding protein